MEPTGQEKEGLAEKCLVKRHPGRHQEGWPYLEQSGDKGHEQRALEDTC